MQFDGGRWFLPARECVDRPARDRYLRQRILSHGLGSPVRPPRTTRLASIVLLVTWLNPGQPPASSQAIFNSMVACQAARDGILEDARHIKEEYAQADRQDA